ncbi:MAG: hypothetical protein ABI091_26005, partial [Ferruginibacter sp.]
SGSPAIDAGFNVGLPYNGSAPDIGAFETGAAPTVNAGTDQSITVNTASLSGSATGTIVSYLWSKQSGGSATIVTPNSATTSLTGLVNGTYQFKLTATDNLGISASDIVQVIVNIPAPVVNAGVDQSLTASSGTLTGTATDAGTITSTIWTKISGAAGMSFGSPTSLTTTITGLINGVYQFALKATNNNGLFTIDTVKVTVNIAPPVVNAGTDQSIAVSTTTLTGTATGTIASYNWSKISGPSATITSPTSASTGISGLGTGVYLFKLTATNSDGISASDTMKVTVTIPIAAPTISTTDKTITTYSTTLSATATTEVGHTGTYIWTQISGPSASITSATTLTPSVVVTGTGIYVFRARITQDDAQTAYSDLTLTVNIPIPAPTVTTINKTVTTTTTGLTATVTSATGYGVTYLWTQTSGFTATILNPTTLTPTITGLSTGICKFRIFVTQSDGQTAYSDLTLTVSIPNLPPIVSAGANQILYLPTDTTSFSGSVTPASGTTISSTVWTKTSGGTYGMIGAGTLTPTLSGLNGNYVFRLTATQSDTQVAYNELVVSVVPLATTSSWKYPSIIIFENIP